MDTLKFFTLSKLRSKKNSIKNLTLLIVLTLLNFSCSDKKEKVTDDASTSLENTANSDPSSYDADLGEGKYKKIDLAAGIDKEMAVFGQKVTAIKCSSCHKMSSEMLVGPGWKGVTRRRSPEWIMNFITNPEVMLDKDPELQKQLELCLVRMPNQFLKEKEARSILEYMRENDTKK